MNKRSNLSLLLISSLAVAGSLVTSTLLTGCGAPSDGKSGSVVDSDAGEAPKPTTGSHEPESLDDDAEADAGADPGGEPDAHPNDPQGEQTISHLFMPTPEAVNTRAPKLLVDGNGDLHALYPAYAGGDAYYAFCPDGCRDESMLRVVELPVEGTVVNAMLTVTKSGAPRVLLSTLLELTWAECDEDCTDPAKWRSSLILEHGGDLEVSGNALALDAADRPRFIAHTYLALLGIGQKTPATYLSQCDVDCTDPANWRMDPIADQIWQMSQLQYDRAGNAHLATVAVDVGAGGPMGRMAAYLNCASGCDEGAGWTGIRLMAAYEDYAEEIQPAIAMDLTTAGDPRVAVLGELDAHAKGLFYFECDEGCAEDNWRAALISQQDQLGAGVDMELDLADRPRMAFTLADNIGVYSCESSDCTSKEATWDLHEVEFATELPRDNIILWPNCTIDTWVLHEPSLVIDDGFAFVGYQATDSSGGFENTDPTKPECLAGKDMTLARLAHLVVQ